MRAWPAGSLRRQKPIYHHLLQRESHSTTCAPVGEQWPVTPFLLVNYQLKRSFPHVFIENRPAEPEEFVKKRRLCVRIACCMHV